MNLKHLQKYCNEDISLVENYEEAVNDAANRWAIHHRLETHNSNGERRLAALSSAELVALDMYYNRPASELIFMKKSEHSKLHNETMTKETKKKISEAKKEKRFSEEHKKSLSEAHKGGRLSEETRKKLSEASKGRCHTEEAKKKISKTLEGHKVSEETKRKISEAVKKRWQNLS